MGRRRALDPDEVLNAAERVVLRSGSAGLSIDAVAKEAGISKSQVVYDHKTKNALLEALITRQIDRERLLVNEAMEDCAESPYPALFARVVVAQKKISDSDRAVAMAICASLSEGEGPQELLKQWQKRDLEAVVQNASRPRAARASYLALCGFYALELYSLYKWSEAEHEEILRDIETIFVTFPDD